MGSLTWNGYPDSISHVAYNVVDCCVDCSAPSVPAVSSVSACRTWWCARAVTSTMSTVSGAWRAVASWFPATSSRSATTVYCAASTTISPSTSSCSVWAAAAVGPSRVWHSVLQIASTVRTWGSLPRPATTTTTTMKRPLTTSQVYIYRRDTDQIFKSYLLSKICQQTLRHSSLRQGGRKFCML